MKILLVGATGTLGRQIAKHAIEEAMKLDVSLEIHVKLLFSKNGGVNLQREIYLTLKI